MARRAAPPGSGPAYISKSQVAPRRNESEKSGFASFLDEEVWAPEKLAGNISIVTAVTVFLGGIAVVRTWGDIFIPA